MAGGRASAVGGISSGGGSSLELSALPLVRLPVRLLAGGPAVSCDGTPGALLQPRTLGAA